MPSITRHKDRWRAHVFVAGERKTKVFDTKREAQRWALETESKLTQARRSGRTLEQAIQRYAETVSAHKRDPEWERRRLDAALAHFGDVPLSDIDSDRIARWRDARLKTVSGSTVQREANLLRHLFTVACDEWRWIERNPFRGVRMPAHNDPRHQVWTWQLIKRVLRAPRTGKTAEMQAAFRIALHTGLRLSEVLSAQYDERRHVLLLERTKTGGRVEVPTVRRARRWLPFRGSVGPNEGSVLFSKLCRELLIDGLTFHDSRGSALTWLSRRMDVLTLSRISRHRDLRVLSSVYYRESAAQIAARL